MPSLFDNIRSKFGPSVAATPKPPTRTDSGTVRTNTADNGSREEIQRRIELLRRMNNAYDTMTRQQQAGGAHRPTPILARQQLQHPSASVQKYRVRFREHIGSPLQQQQASTASGHRTRAHYQRPSAQQLDYDGDDSSAGPASPTEQYYSHVPEYASVNGRVNRGTPHLLSIQLRRNMCLPVECARSDPYPLTML